MPTVTPPKYTKQVMVLLDPDVSGVVYAWAEVLGVSASAASRQLIAGGLEVCPPAWATLGVEAPTAERIAELQAEHRAQGEAQTERRRGDDADRRKSSA